MQQRHAKLYISSATLCSCKTTLPPQYLTTRGLNSVTAALLEPLTLDTLLEPLTLDTLLEPLTLDTLLEPLTLDTLLEPLTLDTLLEPFMLPAQRHKHVHQTQLAAVVNSMCTY